MIHPNYYVQTMQQNNANQAMNATFANGYSADMPKIQENPQTLDQAAELARRRHMQQRQQEMPMYSLDVNVHSAQNSMPNLSSGSMLLSPGSNPNDMVNNFRMNPTLTKGHSSQPGINYMQQNASMGPNMKQLPPTAPKPQINRSQQSKDDLSPPLPPSATHPLFKNVNTSLNSPNANYTSAYYPSSSTLPKSFIAPTSSNPWEREEREKEQEIRREQARQWREHHIIELSSLPHRTPQQEEQLKTLILERDFERLAQEQGDLEEDNDNTYGKENVQEVIRLTQNPNQLSTPITSMKQVDLKTNIVTQTGYPNASNNESGSHGLNDSGLQQQQAIAGQQSMSSNVQPKSILKHNNARVERTNASNPSSPSKQAKSTTFADDRQSSDPNSSISAISSVVRDLNNMSFNETTTTISTSNYQIKEISELNDSSLNGPPPPPERNSSYVVMSQKQQSIRNNNLNLTMASQPVKKSSTNATSNAGTDPSSTIGQFMLSNKKSIASTNSGGINSPNNSTINSNNHSMNNNDSNNNSANNSNINGGGVPSVNNISTSNLNSSIVNSNTNHNNDSNTSGSNISNLSNNNVISSNTVTTASSSSVQSTANLSLAAMMAQRDNKRVSFHDEENNLLMSSTSSIGDQAELSIVREDPNVRHSAKEFIFFFISSFFDETFH